LSEAEKYVGEQIMALLKGNLTWWLRTNWLFLVLTFILSVLFCTLHTRIDSGEALAENVGYTINLGWPFPGIEDHYAGRGWHHRHYVLFLLDIYAAALYAQIIAMLWINRNKQVLKDRLRPLLIFFISACAVTLLGIIFLCAAIIYSTTPFIIITGIVVDDIISSVLHEPFVFEIMITTIFMCIYSFVLVKNGVRRFCKQF
jgi:hypothetical protein